MRKENTPVGIRIPLEDWDRRAFLQLLGVSALGLAM